MFIDKYIYAEEKVQFSFPLFANCIFSIEINATKLMVGDALYIDLSVDLHCAKDRVYY